MVAVVIFYYLLLVLCPVMFDWMGLVHLGRWFLDSFAILASSDFAALGHDPHQANPLDPMRRPHVYSDWWLGFAALGITRAHNFWVGGAFVAAFFLLAFAILRPRSGPEAGWYLLFLCAPPAMVAVERANNDLVIFCLLAWVPLLLADGRRWVRWCSLVPLLLATGLKFYPAVAGLLLLDGKRREACWRAGVGVVLLGLLFAGLYENIRVIQPLVPAPGGANGLGGRNIFLLAGQGSMSAGVCMLAVLVLGVWACRPMRLWAGISVKDGMRRDWLLFALGSAVLCGCFFAGTSYYYRMIFGVMLAPLTWRLLQKNAMPRASRTWVKSFALLLVFMMWGDAFLYFGLVGLRGTISMPVFGGVMRGVEYVREAVTWAFMFYLAGFLMRFTRDAWRNLRRGDTGSMDAMVEARPSGLVLRG